MSRSASLLLAATLVGATACASSSGMSAGGGDMPAAARMPMTPPSPDPRIGLSAGLFDAGEAVWNLRKLSSTPPGRPFLGSTNSDLAFSGQYVFQGNYNGIQIWDISNPASPVLVNGYVCPASQSDVSVAGNLMFVSGEGLGGRLDCGTQGVRERVSPDRLRGLRIFDISDVRNPRYVTNVQTCRGSHTHTVLEPVDDPDNVYVYISGSAGIRPAEELAGCVGGLPSDEPNSALFRIEVIRVPRAHPEQAAIVSSPRIFNDLTAPPQHGLAPDDLAEINAARARGSFVITFGSNSMVLPDQFARRMLDSVVTARGGTGAATAADSAAVRTVLDAMVARMTSNPNANLGPTQCHDITVYPAIGLAGGACEGYGLLLDIRDPANPVRVAAVADSNFSYWHSATFNNDGTKVLFSDEWGGGGGPKCRANDPYEWGANAIFTIADRQMQFRSYYKMPAAQTSFENCVAHNGSLIPIPGRDVMVQSWYQGGISVFDWTDAAHPVEIAFHDRGPVNGEEAAGGGSWSVYWYNGVIVSSEIARGLDIFELTPSGWLSANEIEAARSVRFSHYNTQGQQRFEWPATFALARAFADQLERGHGLSAERIAAVRAELARAERASGSSRRQMLTALAGQVAGDADAAADGARVRLLADAVRRLAAAN